MLPLLLSTLLLSDLSACDITVEPTPCERALAEELMVDRGTCKAKLEVKDMIIAELRNAALEPPPPPPPSLSLLGMPKWVTPALAVLLFSSGLAIGFAVK